MRGLFLFLLTFSVLCSVQAVEILPTDSPLKLDLYGVILANTYWNSNGLFGSDVPLWVVSPTDLRADQQEFGMTARQSRFGFKLKAPDVGSAKLTGVLEMDLFGGFPASGQSASFPDLRLRLGYMKLQWDTFSFTAGQDWIILAPLNPTTLSHFAVVGLASSGNLWLRYPMLRMDSTHRLGNGEIGFTVGLVRPVGGSDVPPGGSLIDLGGAGERSGMPFFQGRSFYKQGTLVLGISAHYGKEKYKEKLDTWAVAADFQIPVTAKINLQGEIFSGANLDSFQGGVNQGVSKDRPIDTRGGWMQLSFQARPTMSFHLAAGLDDPRDEDLLAGQRGGNTTVMAGILYKPSRHFQVGVEYNRITTRYVSLPKSEAGLLNVAFSFWF